MMGRTHVTSGAAAGALTLPLLPPASPVVQLAWLLSWAGAALAPDLDTTTSSAARMWGPASRVLALALGRVSGGHRWGTHDLLLAPVLCVCAVTAAAVHPLGAAVVLALVSGLAVQGLAVTGARTLRAAGPVLNLTVSAAAAWSVTARGADTTWWEVLPWAVAGGVAIHILGDALTRQGIPVPVAWIWTRARIPGPVFLTTGGVLEQLLITPLLAAITLWAVWSHTDLAGLVARLITSGGGW